jgi:hypothetical protein
MKARTFIITASVALALVVPTAAGAAAGRAPVELRTSPSTKVAKMTALERKQAAKIKALLAKNDRIALRIRLLKTKAQLQAARISQLEARLAEINRPAPGPSGPSTALDPSEEECRDYGTSCTDEQNCRYWGNNCNVAPPVDNTSSNAASDAAPADETQLSNETSSTESTDSQSQPDFVDTPCDPQWEYC